jgi:hypothetical protein
LSAQTLKIQGSQIKDIVGYVSNEFGDPIFKLSKIIFEDGIEYWCEGEHDMPYVTDVDEGLLQSIYDDEEE